MEQTEALPGVFGKRGIYFRGAGEQRPNFEGNKDNRKTNFGFGNRGTSQFISREQWEGLQTGFGNNWSQTYWTGFLTIRLITNFFRVEFTKAQSGTG